MIPGNEKLTDVERKLLHVLESGLSENEGKQRSRFEKIEKALLQPASELNRFWASETSSRM
jgi:hypothetical protein